MMDLEKAKHILHVAKISHNTLDGRLYNPYNYVSWVAVTGEKITLDVEFTADELEAMAIWMRHYGT